MLSCGLVRFPFDCRCCDVICVCVALGCISSVHSRFYLWIVVSTEKTVKNPSSPTHYQPSCCVASFAFKDHQTPHNTLITQEMKMKEKCKIHTQARKRSINMYLILYVACACFIIYASLRCAWLVHHQIFEDFEAIRSQRTNEKKNPYCVRHYILFCFVVIRVGS